MASFRANLEETFGDLCEYNAMVEDDSVDDAEEETQLDDKEGSDSDDDNWETEDSEDSEDSDYDLDDEGSLYGLC
jgi:hypothetical protein